jgi:NadR type nicotinamide-nucleotide adenylyltransferase
VAEISETFDTGLVFGKFYPLTKGHQFLIDTARGRCRKLYVAISGRPSETIPQSLRADWIRRLYPDAIVVAQPQSLPYYPEDCETEDEFYRIWTGALRDVCGGRSPDVIFTSEDYGSIMARFLGCGHVHVDRKRQTVPISATQVRADPFSTWEFLDPVVRAHFVKVVCVYGAESTGKTTLCAQLAQHFNTVWQPEWAREYLGERHCTYDDMEIIARGHSGAYPRYRERANKVLFMDTDAITTKIFSDWYYGHSPKYVTELADRMREYVDLYLVMDIDVPWVPDTSRDLGQPWQRAALHARHVAELEQRTLPYVIIRGNWKTRTATAIQAVEQAFFKR